MKKTWKRLCTGFLALATVVTALPTTPVHAESKQYWTESAERVGIIEKVMNDGSIGSTFNEGYMKVEGETAYCIDINTDFKKSDVYFCIYEKDYEQYVKLGTPLEEADIINRFEIRLRNERAYYAVRDLLTYYDAEQTAFSIINQYVRFVDEEPDKRKNDWKLNDRWAWFIGDNRQSLKLTTKPEPYTLDRTLRWVQRQVAPTLKMLKKIDKGNGTDYIETIEQQAKLTEKHEMIIKQQTTPAKDLVES